MCPISLLCRIHYTIKITLVQCVAPAVWFAMADVEPRGKKEEEEEKKTFCRSSFSLAAGEQIKET